jgi:ribonuclease R
MIEEWMLMANRAVAIKLSGKEAAGIAVYRIHDRPAPDRVLDLQTFLKTLGYNVTISDGIIPPEQLQEILNNVDNDTARDTIQSSIVRSLAKAIYSTLNRLPLLDYAQSMIESYLALCRCLHCSRFLVVVLVE